MEHGGLAVAAPGCQKSGHSDRPTEGYRLKPAGGFAQGHDGNFTSHLPRCAGFFLLRSVFQDTFANRNSGGGITQRLALA